jgi:hypothetical protein
MEAPASSCLHVEHAEVGLQIFYPNIVQADIILISYRFKVDRHMSGIVAQYINIS